MNCRIVFLVYTKYYESAIEFARTFHIHYSLDYHSNKMSGAGVRFCGLPHHQQAP
jgi:hypothetical protein